MNKWINQLKNAVFEQNVRFSYIKKQTLAPVPMKCIVTKRDWTLKFHRQ